MIRWFACLTAVFLLAGCSYTKDYILDGTIQNTDLSGQGHVFGTASESNGQLHMLQFSSEMLQMKCTGYSDFRNWEPDPTINDVMKNETEPQKFRSKVPVSCNNGDTGNITLSETKEGYLGQGEIGKSTVSFRLIWDREGLNH